jgi:hypothetical protein
MKDNEHLDLDGKVLMYIAHCAINDEHLTIPVENALRQYTYPEQVLHNLATDQTLPSDDPTFVAVARYSVPFLLLASTDYGAGWALNSALRDIANSWQ